MQSPFDPILFQIGPVTLRWYGVLIVTGILLAAWVAARYVERKGESGDSLWDLLLCHLHKGIQQKKVEWTSYPALSLY